MKIRFKSVQAKNEFRNIFNHNIDFVNEFGMGIIQIDRVDENWWDILDPISGSVIYTVDAKLESKYFDIVSE
ncbi:adenosylcobinamide-phosphate guanylyltransferase [Aeromonas phage ZPAH1]|nr:adenosylcobinamide-phosphate guanylyltransferase [Aeromonas phage ZPAH1]